MSTVIIIIAVTIVNGVSVINDMTIIIIITIINVIVIDVNMMKYITIVIDAITLIIVV
jgi:hypothetical protein